MSIYTDQRTVLIPEQGHSEDPWEKINPIYISISSNIQINFENFRKIYGDIIIRKRELSKKIYVKHRSRKKKHDQVKTKKETKPR